MVIKTLEKIIAELKAENEKLMAECDMYKTFYRAKHSDIKGLLLNYKQTLQEIKAIAEIKIDCKQYEIDHDCFNDTRCKALKELIETLQEILELITKAEEE